MVIRSTFIEVDPPFHSEGGKATFYSLMDMMPNCVGQLRFMSDTPCVYPSNDIFTAEIVVQQRQTKTGNLLVAKAFKVLPSVDGKGKKDGSN